MRLWSRSLIGVVSWASSTVLVIVACGVAPASAAGSRRAKDLREVQENAARKACMTGDYDRGISILADMFIEHRDPVFVFNQGRCLEQNARYKDAVMRFEEYLRLGDTMKLPEGAPEIAKKHIEDCKAKLAEESRPAAPPPVVQPVPQPLPQVTPPPPAPSPLVQPEPVNPGNGLLVGGIVTGTVGVAAAVTGVFFGLKSNNMVDQMQTNRDSYTSSKHASQQTYKTLAWVGYGVGATCIAGGAVMIAIAASRSKAESQVAFVPVLGPGQAGILLRGGL